MPDLDLRNEVTAFCAEIGRDRLLVQGAGGNVSWKQGDVLWVKASGRWLAEAGQREIFVSVALGELRDAIARREFDVTPRALGSDGLKPSIETLLHAVMPHRVVAHLHAIDALVPLVQEDGLSTIAQALDGEMTWRAVEYRKPGAELAQAVADELGQEQDVDVILLQNHGVVVGGDSVDDVLAKVNRLAEKLSVPARLSSAADGVDAEWVPAAGYIRPADTAVQSLALDERYFQRLSRDWVLYPDHVVFLGAVACTYESAEAATQGIAGLSEQPELVFIRGRGVFVRETFNEAKQAQLACYGDVMVRQPDTVELRSLTRQDIGALLNWDAERYRQALNK